MPHPLSIPPAALCKETAVKLAGKRVTRTRLAAGKGLRPTRQSLGEGEMQTGCLELPGEQSFIFEAISIAGGKAPTDRRQEVRYDSRTGSGGARRELAGTRGASTARRKARGRRAHGCGAGAAGQLLRLLSARPRHGPAPAPPAPPARPATQPAGSGRGTDPLWGGTDLRPLPPLSGSAPRPRAWSRSLRG